ncbi:baseplate assembly protein W [Vibrio sp. V37_P2S8PM304]|uniref:baseplate assembly protein W n=1 Tax=Vibrio sp. V37_P2S8PM304 TaxID=1938688 RepID=UPI001372371A|nr:baseplate assembly protein W [Vibrio sp. V37_P2S8PM304]NAX31982.1 baseplate assembly protein W [Vibrio sp. V37_P2S8PM304]
MKQGTSRRTGELIGGLEYLRQRITDALETIQGSLVIERAYGSRMHEVVDLNVDTAFHMKCYVRIAECIANPKCGLEDFRLSDMTVNPLGGGKVSLDLFGFLVENGEPITLEGIIIDASRN